ncbi:hypothetical protein ACLI4B_33645, partial [Pseudomonas aeruginosa]
QNSEFAPCLCLAVSAICFMLRSLPATSALIVRQPAVGMLHIEPAAGGVLLALGLLSLCLGVFFWRFSRRRSRRNSDLSLSPNLMKKRD